MCEVAASDSSEVEGDAEGLKCCEENYDRWRHRLTYGASLRPPFYIVSTANNSSNNPNQLLCLKSITVEDEQQGRRIDKQDFKA